MGLGPSSLAKAAEANRKNVRSWGRQKKVMLHLQTGTAVAFRSLCLYGGHFAGWTVSQWAFRMAISSPGPSYGTEPSIISTHDT